MANMFEGIEEVEREGAKNGYFNDGDYLVEIGKFIAFESENPDTEGEPMVIVECKILEVLTAFEGSNRKDEEVSWFNKPTRLASGKLNTAGIRAMERLKNFAAAALGGVDDTDITAAIVHDLTLADEVSDIGPGEALKGFRLIARARTRTGKKSGKDFTTVTWEFPSE